MATVDYIHHLAFPKLRDAEAKHLAGMATICDFKDGELDFQVGRRGLPLCVVESGDEPVTVAVHGPREFTGDVSLLTDRPATTSGYARGETRAYRVDQGELRRAIQEIPDLSDKLLEAFQARRNMLEHSGFVGVRLLGRLGDPAVTEIREFFDKNKVPHTGVDRDTPDGKTAMDKLDVAPDQLPSWLARSARGRRGRRSPDWPSAWG